MGGGAGEGKAGAGEGVQGDGMWLCSPDSGELGLQEHHELHTPFPFPSTWDEIPFFAPSRGTHRHSPTTHAPELGKSGAGRGGAGCVTTLRRKVSWQSEGEEYDRVTPHNTPQTLEGKTQEGDSSCGRHSRELSEQSTGFIACFFVG